MLYITNVNGDTIDTSKMEVVLTNKTTGTQTVFSNPTPKDSFGVSFTKIQAGSTMKLAGYLDSSYNPCISNKTDINSNDVFGVTIIYAGQHILYDKEVTVA